MSLTKVSLFFVYMAPFWNYSLLLLYSFSITDTAYNWEKNYLWICIYSFVFTIFLFTDLSLLNLDTDRLLTPRWFASLHHLFFKTFKLFIIISGFWFIEQLKIYEKNIKSNFSDIEYIKLFWVKNTMVVYMSVNAVSFVTYILYNLGVIQSIETKNMVVNTVVFLGCFTLVTKV